MSIATEVIIILLLILANGVLAMAELAIVSARRVRLQQRAAEGDQGAAIALDLAGTPNRFLSTIQIGITLIGILAGAFGGATLSRTLTGYLRAIDWLAPYADSLSLVLVVLLITFLTLVLGELVPKRLALNNPEQVARAIARPMRFLSVIAAPIVQLLSFSTEAVLRVLGVQTPVELPVTEEEIRALIDQGTAAGIFHKAEQNMVERVLLLDDRRISALMTPRIDVIWLDLDDPPEELRRKVADSPFSRFPVARGDLDNVLGQVQAKDMLLQSMRGEPFNLEALLRPPLFVPEVMPSLKVLELFKVSSTQIALVVDEYGSVQGIVTLTDILEAIVGDIPMPGEPEEPQAVQRDDGTWLIDGMLPIDDLKELLDIEMLPEEDLGLYQTLAGFVTMQLEHIPSVADGFEWRGMRFEVVDMDGARVDKVLVVPPASEMEEWETDDASAP
ncbi:MAG TPA: HlyC/CorC family transporter [Chloroflexi bacterium]|jgi:putative hemolysin|nr:HlyC/CorC family transporter [Chloroflexota bacterium]